MGERSFKIGYGLESGQCREHINYEFKLAYWKHFLKPFSLVHTSNNLNFVSSFLTQTVRVWDQNSHLIKTLFSPIDTERVLSTLVSPLHRQDILTWLPSADGLFTVKKGYQFAKSVSHLNKDQPGSFSQSHFLSIYGNPSGAQTSIQEFQSGLGKPSKIGCLLTRISTQKESMLIFDAPFANKLHKTLSTIFISIQMYVIYEICGNLVSL